MSYTDIKELRDKAAKIAARAVNHKSGSIWYNYDPEKINDLAKEIAEKIIANNMEMNREIEGLCIKNNEEFMKSFNYFTLHNYNPKRKGSYENEYSEEYEMAQTYLTDIWEKILSASGYSIYKTYAKSISSYESRDKNDFIGLILSTAWKTCMNNITPVGTTESNEYASSRTGAYSKAFIWTLNKFCKEHELDDLSQLNLWQNSALVDEIMYKLHNGVEPFDKFDVKMLTRVQLLEIACRVSDVSIYDPDDNNEENAPQEIPDNKLQHDELITGIDNVMFFVKRAGKMLSDGILISDNPEASVNRNGNTYYGYFMVNVIYIILDDSNRNFYIKELIKTGWFGKPTEVYQNELLEAVRYFDSSERPTLVGLGQCFNLKMENYSYGLNTVYKRLRSAVPKR